MAVSYKDKCVLITGASSGIGRACAVLFASLGARLLLCARSENKLEQLADELPTEAYTFQLDVSDPSAVESTFMALPGAWQSVDLLVNSAGLALGLDKIQEADTDQWDTMIDTNVKGLLYVTRCVVRGMLERQQGHIINIGSISSHQVYSGGAVYCATKFAVRALTEGLKMDVHGTPIRVSLISPGLVDTQFSTTRFAGDAAKADAVYANMQPLLAEDVADAVVYCATRSQHVDVREMTLYPTDQTASHLVHRREP